MMGFKIKTLKFQITFWMAVVALLPFILGTVFVGFYFKDKLYQNHLNNLQVIYREVLEDIDKSIKHHRTIIENTTRIPLVAIELRKANGNTKTIEINPLIQKHIEKLVIKHNYYDFFLISKSGTVVYSYKKESDLGENLLDRYLHDSPLSSAFRQASYTLETAFVDVEYYGPSKLDSAFAVTPIIADGELLGYVGVQLNKETIFGLVKSENGLGVSGEIVAGRIGADSKILAAVPLKYDPHAFDNKRVLNTQGMATGMIQAVHGKHSTGTIVDYRGVRTLAVWGYEPNMRWGIVVKTDEAEVLEGIRAQFQMLFIAFILSIGLVGLAATLISKNISHPILSLVLSMKRFRTDLHHRAAVTQNNEIGFLASEFNAMADNINAQVEKLQEQAALLEEQRQEIEEHSIELEHRVSERTVELSEAKAKVDSYMGIVDKFVVTSTTDTHGAIVAVSSAFCELFGYAREELIGKNHNILRDPIMSDGFFADLWSTLSEGKDWHGEMRNVAKDGSKYWVRAHITPVFDVTEKIVAYTAVMENVTDKKRVEEIAIKDQLTGLYNRRYLEERFVSEADLYYRYETPFSIAILDLDKFKSINDTFGHQVGDNVLKSLAKILTGCVRNTDIVGRWGGEEFLIILPLTTLENAAMAAEHIRKEIEKYEFETVGHRTASFGVAEYISSIDETIKKADEALYAAKEGGRNKVCS